MGFIDAVGIVFIQMLVSIQAIGGFLAEAESDQRFVTQGLVERGVEIAPRKACETGLDSSRCNRFGISGFDGD